MKANWINKTAALVIALILILPGCSAAPTPADTTAAPQTATPTQQALLEATPAPEPVKGGTLRLTMPVNADKTDPLLVNTEEMLMLYSLVFEGLLAVDETGAVIPCLAENWTCDETGAVWTLHLRQAARWQDTGTPVTAADVADTWRRIEELGARSYYSYAQKKISSITAAENGDVIVTMKQPGLASLYALTFPITHGSGATGNYPAGTGAYKFSYVSDDTVRLERNTNWWKQAANIEYIEFKARENNDVSLASFAAGQLDMVFTSSLSVGRYRNEANTVVLDMMTQNVETLLFNFSNPYLRDIKVRQAIAYAINRSRIITNVYMNRARACDVPVPPDSWLYESKSALYDYNPEVALKLFADAGWADADDDGYLEKDGAHYDELTLKLLVNETTDSVRSAAAMQIAAQLEEIGVHVELVSAAFTLGDDNSEYLTMLRGGTFDIALAGFNLGRDCDLTAYVAADGARNYGHFSNAAVELLAKKTLAATTETELKSAASELQLAIATELPFITLYFRLNSVLYKTNVEGVAGMREPDVLRNASAWFMR